MLQVLTVIFLGFWIWSGIRPVMVEDWWLEQGLVLLLAVDFHQQPAQLR